MKIFRSAIVDESTFAYRAGLAGLLYKLVTGKNVWITKDITGVLRIVDVKEC